MSSAPRAHAVRTALGVSVAMLAACGPAPLPAPPPLEAPKTHAPAAEKPDPCRTVPGEPAPAALDHEFSGLARDVRCQAGLVSLMTEVSETLGVRCTYCHQEGDYAAPSERKRVANWMSTELVPALATKRGKRAVSCGHCHRSRGKPEAKLLGEPRSEAAAIEWMTTHMVEDFVMADGKPLRCKSCHGGNIGSHEFRRRIVLTHLEGLSPGAALAPPSAGAEGQP